MGRSMSNIPNKPDAASELLPVVVGMIHSVSTKAKQQDVKPRSLLLEELALDSLDLVRVVMLMEDRYRITIDLDEVPKLKCVSDLTIMLARELRSAAA
jgi:acyl carrier protein